jgi:hypothetical protein
MSSTVALSPEGIPKGQTYCSAAPELSKLLVSRAGGLASLVVENKGAAILYAFVFDGIDAATGTLIYPPIPIPINGLAKLEERYMIPFKKGLFVSVSTTDAAYTVAAGTPAWFYARWCNDGNTVP